MVSRCSALDTREAMSGLGGRHNKVSRHGVHDTMSIQITSSPKDKHSVKVYTVHGLYIGTGPVDRMACPSCHTHWPASKARCPGCKSS